MTLVLASKSAARRHMLEAAGLPFEVRTGDGDEEQAKRRLRGDGLAALDLALALAEYKALDVAAEPGELVIGADQTLECHDGAMLDKPESPEAMAAQLRMLAGHTHFLHSGAAVVESARTVWSEAQSVAMTMRPLSEAFIASYVEREYQAVRYNVGGYRIEGPGVQLFDRIEGSHFAILGLPLVPLLGYLRERGVLPS